MSTSPGLRSPLCRFIWYLTALHISMSACTVRSQKEDAGIYPALYEKGGWTTHKLIDPK